MKSLKTFFPFVLLLFISLSYGKEVGFTQEDRERLIRLEATLKAFMRETDRRFEQIDKRFEQIDKRFEQVDKRFEDINKRFGDINKRFEDINKRIDELRQDMNARFEQLYTFLWIITGIFTTLTISVIGFAWWDRRTIIRKAREETVEYLKREGDLRKVIEVLKEKAKTDKELAEILRSHGLL